MNFASKLRLKVDEGFRKGYQIQLDQLAEKIATKYGKGKKIEIDSLLQIVANEHPHWYKDELVDIIGLLKDKYDITAESVQGTVGFEPTIPCMSYNIGSHTCSSGCELSSISKGSICPFYTQSTCSCYNPAQSVGS